MPDILKKSIYLGLEITTATKEKVESVVDKMIEKGFLARGEKLKAVKEILHTLEKKEKEFEEETSAIVSEPLSDIQVAPQKDLEELNKCIADLEKIDTAKSNGNKQVNK